MKHWRERAGLAATAMLWALSGALGQQTKPASAPMSRAAMEQLQTRASEAMQAGQFAVAIAAYQKLVQAQPHVAPLRANLCVAQYSAHQFHSAAASCREAIRLAPSLKAPHEFLVLSLAEGGDCQAALPILTSLFPAVRQLPMKRQMGLDGVSCAMNLGKMGQATALMNSLVGTFPNDPNILYAAAHLYSDLSTHFSERLLRVAPGSARAHDFNAEVLEFQGKLQDAAAEYRKALRLDPSLPNVHYRLGKLLLRMATDNQTLAQARRQFEDELRVNPQNAEAEYQLGEMAWRARNWNRAVQYLRQAAALEPQSPLILTALGRALVSDGKSREAISPLATAARLAPNDPTVHYELGIALLHVGHRRQADQQMAVYARLQRAAQARKALIRNGIQGASGRVSDAKP